MADILKEKGNEAFKQKRYEQADKLYRDATTLDPGNPVLYSNRSMSLIKLERWNECIQVVDQGLEQLPDSKTKVKLLWRKGTALSKINEFLQSRECYNDALKLDETNQSVLKSIGELDVKESQFKRSHSIDEFQTDKRTKNNDSIDANFVKIPVFEVDELPAEFQDANKNINEKTIQQRQPEPSFKALHKSKSNNNTQEILPTKPASIQDIQSSSESSKTKTPSIEAYPEVPTIHALSTIVNTKPSEESLSYLFSITPVQYSKLFQNGNIDHKILNCVLDSIIYRLQTSTSSDIIQRANDLLEALARAPRFNLVQLFVDKQKLNEVSRLTNGAEALKLWT